MKLPRLALKNYQFVLILIGMATYLGVSSIRTMPRNEDPNPAFPIYNVVVIYPGASPEDVEELVVDPLEEELDQLDDVDHITTIIEEGLAIITVEAFFGVDVDEKFDEVLREVKNVEPDLPDEIFSVDVYKFEPNQLTAIQQIALAAPDRSFAEIEAVAEKLENRLERLDGIDNVAVLAYPEEVIKVKLDLQRMSAFNISVSDVAQTLTSQNLNIPAGDLAAGSNAFSVKSSGSFKALDEIGQAVIKAGDGQVVYLKDFAAVEFDYQDDNWIGRHNGHRAVFLTVTQKSGNNLVAIGQAINREMELFETTLPNGYTLSTVFEQAPAVSSRITGFFWNLVQGVILVGVVIFLFLGFRPSVIIMTVIPLSIIIGIGVLDFADYALQQISIAALVIALGLLVDNGIVVVENIQRYLKQGMALREAAIKGTSEVGFAVTSSTVTTLLAFAPLVLLNSGPGEFLRSLPLTVIFVMIISLALALTFTPLVAGRFLKARKVERPRLVDRRLGQFIKGVYVPALRFSLKRGWLIIVTGVVLLVGSASLFPSIGVSFFPTADKPLLLIEVDAPRGSSLEQTDRAVRYVEQALDTIPFVTQHVANVGHGNPTIYYNRSGESYKKYHGQLLVNFERWDPRKFYQTLEALRVKLAAYPDARITFQELKNGPPIEAPIEVRLIGPDLGLMKEAAFEVEQLIANTPGTIDIDNPLRLSKTDLKVRINRDKASMAGVSLAEIDQVMRVGVDGLAIDEVSFRQDDYDILLQADYASDRLSELNKIHFSNFQGLQVPLAHLAEFEFLPAIGEIRHYDTERSTSITASLVNPDEAIAKTELLIAELEELELPEGIRYEMGGEYESQQESFGDLGTLLIVALLGIFAVLVLQFRSWTQPLIVFAAIPLAITGSFIALFLTGWSFSFFAFVGFISLVGIVVNNSIILVDYTNQLMNGGMKKSEAILMAAQTRFTPIVLTTLTTILGLVPLTFQATNLWSPLGWTIIGGMISSTLLTLFVVPVLYQWLTRSGQVA
ncbi:MAG: efflux RND transporter permease subunit [Bacteroidota bacterium]